MLSIRSHIYKKSLRGLACVLGLSVLFSSFPSYATEKETNIAANQAVVTESNEWTDWPDGPIVSAESAILMEAETGVILYAKNIHKQQYPASTTKILTSLIAIETCSMDEMVTFSHDAVFSIDYGSNHIGIDVGEQITIEQCLNAILIRSANEVSFGVAEHIAGGNWRDFAAIMNERAKELGCLNSNFVNPNGLPNEEHVTTAYDLAMIGRAFFANEILCKMTTTRRLHIPPSDTQPHDIIENNKMELIQGGAYEYEYLVGCKTGYTDVARSCLVSCAEKDGLKLICVVLKDEAPYQYEDTIALFEYGFSNFEKRNVSQNETRYNLGTGNLFYNDQDIFGSSQSLLTLNQQDYIILPKTAAFEDADSEISYDTESAAEAAVITYTYHDVYVGSASIDFTLEDTAAYEFEASTGEDITTSSEAAISSAETSKETEKEKPSFVFINLKKILLIAAIVIGVLILLALLLLFLKNFQFNSSRRSRDLWIQKRRHGKYYRQRVSTDLRKKRKQQIAEAKRRQKRTRR